MPKRIVTVDMDGRTVRVEVPMDATTDEIHSFIRSQQRSAQTQAQDAAIAQENFQKQEAGYVNPYRPEIRKYFEGLSGADRFIAESVLPVVGGALGGIAGGTGGELLSQELGVSPYSKSAAAMSVAVPAGLGLAARTPKAISGLARLLPVTREAIVNREIELATKWTDDVAGMLGAKPAAPLWNAVRSSGVQIPRENLGRTSSVISEIAQEAADKANAFPEARDIANLASSIKDKLLSERGAPRVISTPGPGGYIRGGGISLPGMPNPSPDIADIYTNIQSLGRQIGKLEGQGGLSEGARKKLYKSFFDDLESIPSDTPAGQAVSVLSQARAASKTGFAIDEVDNIIQGSFGKPGLNGKAVFDAGKALKKLGDITNPKNANYDKNFTDGLGTNNIEILRDNLDRINRLNLTPLGPGKLIVAGVWAGIGASVGAMTGIPGARELGALVGVSIPSRLSQVLLNTKGGEMIDRLIRMGQGEVSDRALNAIGQTLRKSAENPEAAGSIINSFTDAIPSGPPSGPQENDPVSQLGGMSGLLRRPGYVGLVR